MTIPYDLATLQSVLQALKTPFAWEKNTPGTLIADQDVLYHPNGLVLHTRSQRTKNGFGALELYLHTSCVAVVPDDSLFGQAQETSLQLLFAQFGFLDRPTLGDLRQRFDDRAGPTSYRKLRAFSHVLSQAYPGAQSWTLSTNKNDQVYEQLRDAQTMAYKTFYTNHFSNFCQTHGLTPLNAHGILAPVKRGLIKALGSQHLKIEYADEIDWVVQNAPFLPKMP